MVPVKKGWARGITNIHNKNFGKMLICLSPDCGDGFIDKYKYICQNLSKCLFHYMKFIVYHLHKTFLKKEIKEILTKNS